MASDIPEHSEEELYELRIEFEGAQAEIKRLERSLFLSKVEAKGYWAAVERLKAENEQLRQAIDENK